MKKTILLVISIFILLFIGSSALKKEETIELVSLDDREKMLLEASGANHYFVYDVMMESKYSKVESWVEHYENGEFIKTSDVIFAHYGSPVSAKNGNLIFTLNNNFADYDKQIYMLSFRNDEGTSKGWTVIDNYSGSSFQHAVNEKEKIVTDEPIVIAVIAGGQTNIVNFSDKVFSKDKEELDKVLQNDYAQIFYLRFSEKR